MSDFRFNTANLILTKSEEKIINYIYEHLSMIPFLSIVQISEELDISIATLSRFVRHVGYENYKDLKTAIMEHEKSPTPASKLQKTLSKKDSTDIKSLLKIQEEYLNKTSENISEEDVNRAIDYIFNSKNIYLFGKGASRGLTELFAFRLKRFNKKIFLFNSGGSAIFEDLAHIDKNDLIIIFGFHKTPIEAKVILEYSKETGCKTILFTDQLYLEENLKGTVNFYVYRGEVKEYHSMSSPTALIDSLIILLAKRLEQESVDNLSKLYKLKEKYKDEIPR